MTTTDNNGLYTLVPPPLSQGCWLSGQTLTVTQGSTDQNRLDRTNSRNLGSARIRTRRKNLKILERTRKQGPRKISKPVTGPGPRKFFKFWTESDRSRTWRTPTNSTLISVSYTIYRPSVPVLVNFVQSYERIQRIFPEVVNSLILFSWKG